MAAGEHDDKLREAEKYMNDLFLKATKKEDQYKRHEKHYSEKEKELKRLTKELEELKKKHDKLEPETAELDKKESSSRDARKMYGDVTPGDTTHQDVILLYQNYFKNAFRNLPKDLKADSKEDKYELWKKAADMLMVSFEQNKIAIIEMLTLAISNHSLSNPPSKAIDDKRADYYRGFHVFLRELLEREEIEQQAKQRSSQGIKQQLLESLSSKGWKKETANQYVDFLIDMLIQLDPEDYHSFIQDGKKHRSTKPEAAAVSIIRSKSVDDSARAEEKHKNTRSRCAACKRGFNYGDTPYFCMDLYWHRHHSYCARCNKLNDATFHLMNNDRTYCSSCLLCSVCQQPLDEKSFTDTGIGPCHEKCLACVYCRDITENMAIIRGSFVCGKCSQHFK